MNGEFKVNLIYFIVLAKFQNLGIKVLANKFLSGLYFTNVQPELMLFPVPVFGNFFVKYYVCWELKPYVETPIPKTDPTDQAFID